MNIDLETYCAHIWQSTQMTWEFLIVTPIQADHLVTTLNPEKTCPPMLCGHLFVLKIISFPS